MKTQTITMSSGTVYPVAIEGNNVLISASGAIQIAEKINHLNTAGIPTDAAYLNLQSDGQTHIKIKWLEETMWVTQITGGTVILGIYSW